MGRRLVASLFLMLAVCLVVLPWVQGQGPQKGRSGAIARETLQLQLPGLAAPDSAQPPVQLAAQGWTTLFSEDFEGSFPAAPWGLSGDPTWDKTNYRQHGGSYSAYCAAGGSAALNPPGPYADYMEASMSVGPFDLSNATDAEVVFSHWTDSEVDYDWLYLLATANGEDWDGPAWSGDWTSPDGCNGWCEERISLTEIGELGNLCGEPEVWIAFVFYSDVDTHYEGSYLDDITVRAMAEGGPTPTHTPTPTRTLTGEPTRTPTRTQPSPGGRKIYLPVMRRAPGPPVMASKVIRTNEEGTVNHPSGAQIYVPRGAVPKAASGQDGEMLFTIESGSASNFYVPETPPAGYQFAGTPFAVGPEGFVFAQPVSVRLPKPGGAPAGQHRPTIFEYDHAARQWKNIGGTVSRDGSSISVDRQDLNSVVIYGFPTGGCTPGNPKDAGAIQFDAVTGYSFSLCISSFTLADPVYDSGFVAAGRTSGVIRRDSAQCPADGQVYWILPQGTFTLDVGVYYHRYNDQPPEYLGYFTRTVTLTQPHYDWQGCGPGNFYHTTFFGPMVTGQNSLLSGPPPCMGIPTPAVGIGTVNVRLEWSVRADLDLWVVDPCGQTIYFGATSRTCQNSLGQLDQDNTCGGTVGRPENIFWSTNAPRGTYKVYVDYYSNCGSTGAVDYTVRWWVKGAAYSKRGSIQPPASAGQSGDEVWVTDFTN
jgi:hypothetical protein